MHAALVVTQGVDLVDDDVPHVLERQPEPLSRQDDEQRLRRGDEHVRRLACHRLPFALRRVARAHHRPDHRQLQTHSLGVLANAAQRLEEVLLDVVVERFQGGDVENVHLIAQQPLLAHAEEVVQTRQERRQRLARPGRREDQRVVPQRDLRPRLRLRRRHALKGGLEPGADVGLEEGEGQTRGFPSAGSWEGLYPRAR